jgi:hypothetical protein
MAMDARTAYDVLTRLEKRFENDRFEDFAVGQYRVTWPFLKNQYVIPKLLETGRISEEEADLLDQIRRYPRGEPTRDAEGVDVFPTIYDLLLWLFPVMGIDGQNVFRGQADYRWLLVPTLFRGAPESEELARRQRRTFDFLNRLSSISENYRVLSESDDPTKLVELLAVAQHYGYPTHLLDFTSDLRTAAFFATLHASAGSIGEILVLRKYVYERYANTEGSPFGVFITESAPNPRIARQRGLFIAAFSPAVFQDQRTSFLERIRFHQDGYPFLATGGYSPEHLIDDSDNDMIASLARDVDLGTPSLSSGLERHFQAYSSYIEDAFLRANASMSDEIYAQACAWALRNALPENPEWIDVQVAKLFAMIQIDLQHLPVPDSIKYALRARNAMDTYLESSGTLEQRLALATRLTWLGSVQPGTEEHQALMQTIDRHFLDFEHDVNKR